MENKGKNMNMNNVNNIADEYTKHFEWLNAMPEGVRNIHFKYYDYTGRPNVENHELGLLVDLLVYSQNFENFYTNLKFVKKEDVSQYQAKLYWDLYMAGILSVLNHSRGKE